MSEQSRSWEERWTQGRTCWDLQGHHPHTPLLRSYVSSLGLCTPANTVYVPGCGRAHDAAYFAQLGHKTVAADIVPNAITEAKNLYGNIVGLTLQVEDCLQRAEKPMFDVIFDRAMLCALDEPLRATYIEACCSRLREGGLFLTIPFTDVSLPPERRGPPFALSGESILALFLNDFDLVYWQDFEQPSSDGVIQKEAVVAWRLKNNRGPKV